MKGADAEDRALRELLSSGHTLLRRNYRIPGGEIDLVTQQGGAVIFTEVRQRSSGRFGSADESVTPRKLALLRRAALSYLQRELGREDVECRLQVISIDGPAETGALRCLPVEF